MIDRFKDQSTFIQPLRSNWDDYNFFQRLLSFYRERLLDPCRIRNFQTKIVLKS